VSVKPTRPSVSAQRRTASAPSRASASRIERTWARDVERGVRQAAGTAAPVRRRGRSAAPLARTRCGRWRSGLRQRGHPEHRRSPFGDAGGLGEAVGDREGDRSPRALRGSAEEAGSRRRRANTAYGRTSWPRTSGPRWSAIVPRGLRVTNRPQSELTGYDGGPRLPHIGVTMLPSHRRAQAGQRRTAGARASRRHDGHRNCACARTGLGAGRDSVSHKAAGRSEEGP
jgi:hypothetical protein